MYIVKHLNPILSTPYSLFCFTCPLLFHFSFSLSLSFSSLFSYLPTSILPPFISLPFAFLPLLLACFFFLLYFFLSLIFFPAFSSSPLPNLSLPYSFFPPHTLLSLCLNSFHSLSLHTPCCEIHFPLFNPKPAMYRQKHSSHNHCTYHAILVSDSKHLQPYYSCPLLFFFFLKDHAVWFEGDLMTFSSQLIPCNGGLYVYHIQVLCVCACTFYPHHLFLRCLVFILKLFCFFLSFFRADMPYTNPYMYV